MNPDKKYLKISRRPRRSLEARALAPLLLLQQTRKSRRRDPGLVRIRRAAPARTPRTYTRILSIFPRLPGAPWTRGLPRRASSLSQDVICARAGARAEYKKEPPPRALPPPARCHLGRRAPPVVAAPPGRSFSTPGFLRPLIIRGLLRESYYTLFLTFPPSHVLLRRRPRVQAGSRPPCRNAAGALRLLCVGRNSLDFILPPGEGEMSFLVRCFR